jgi:hypothetical protein
MTTNVFNNGVVTIFDIVEGDVWIEVYLGDTGMKIIDKECVNDELSAMFTSPLLENGQAYKIRYYSKANGIESKRTDFIDITPASAGGYGHGLYGIGVYGIGE